MSVRLPAQREWTADETRVLDAVHTCFERWGMEKTTVDDIAREASMSRATLYRLFPGGRDVVFEAHRVRELDDFFRRLLVGIGDADGLLELLSRAVSVAMTELTADEHLAAMLASEPGNVISEMTVDGLPRILRVANAYLLALVEPYLPLSQARTVIDTTVRLVISHFLVPSDQVDLRNEAQARTFIAPFLPTDTPVHTSDTPVDTPLTGDPA
ncbi:MAG: TetR/AcrR family transcriptional regulator [Actinomycetota bacterium]